MGDVTEYRLTPIDKIVENVGNAEAVLCNKTPFTDDVLKACPNLKYIGLCATGYNNIDLFTITFIPKARAIHATRLPIEP